ncbi:MAG: ABC transporter permease [Anaerolineae bacterium]|nr:ABC transporter permease [Anaerolineae bacterium]
MRRLWVLAWKEVKLAFRDVGAIVTMLVTPLVLTLVIGAAFGGEGDTPLAGIPVLLLDRDQSEFSAMFLDVFEVEDVETLIALERVSDEAAARSRVEADQVAALVIIPEGFGDRVLPMAGLVEERLGLDLLTLSPDAELTRAQEDAIARAFVEAQSRPADPVIVEIYASPDWRLSVSVVKSVVKQGIEIMNLQVQGISTVVGRLVQTQTPSGQMVDRDDIVASQLVDAQDSFGAGAEVSAALPIEVEIVSQTGQSFSWISYTAASMAVLFLMFAVTSGGRTLLAERSLGTLPRLLTAPLTPLTVLLGKMAGIVLTGLLQMLLLWGATSLAGAYWGAVPAVLVSILALVICASSVGALISAWARTPGQAGAIGTAVTLVGSAVSGSFLPRSNLPLWLQRISLVTPNAWGIEIFSRLQLGRDLIEVLPRLGGVLALTVIYYAVALVGFRRQFD